MKTAGTKPQAPEKLQGSSAKRVSKRLIHGASNLIFLWCLILGAGCLSARAAFVYETPLEFITSGDFDGDGKVDIAIWRPNSAVWYVLKSGTPGSYSATWWGMPNDIPITPETQILESLP